MRRSQLESDTSAPFDDEECPKELTIFQTGLPQILAVCTKNVLLLGYGMTLGFPTIVIPAIQGGDGRESSTQGDFLLNKDQISWFSSINLICVPLGCIFSGALTQPIGRKRAMQIVNIPMLTAWLLFHFSTNIYHLYAGLCLAGFSGGLLEAPVLTYVAEVTQPRFRGMLAATGSLSTILGVFTQFVLGTFFKWRTVALCSSVLPIISTTLLFFVPESPHWLIRKKRYEEAKKSFAWLRGWVPIDRIETEYEEIRQQLENQQHVSESCGNKCQLFTKQNFIRPYALICLCFFIGHFSGMTTLQTYAVQIFHTLKAPIDKYYATSLLGISELIGTITCATLVHYTGKRPLVFASTIGCGLCFLGTATYAYFLDIVPGVAVDNIVVNVSLLDPNDYIKIIPLNYSKLITFNDQTIETASNIYEFTDTVVFDDDTFNSTFSPFEYLSDVDSRFGEENMTTDNFTGGFDYENVGLFESQDFAVLFANESYDYIFSGSTNSTKNDAKNGIPDDILVKIPDALENKYLWVPLVLLLGSALLSHSGIRLIPWMLIGEVYSPALRSIASGFSGGTGYVFGFLANKLFLKMISTLTLPGTFGLYSTISLIGALILYFVLPETEGRTLYEIESHFNGSKKLGKKPTKSKNNSKQSISLNSINHHDIIHNPQIIISTSLENQNSPSNHQPINNRKHTNLNFDITNWESNLIFQRHLEQVRRNNEILRNKQLVVNPEPEHANIRNQKMGMKKNKNVHVGGKVNRQYCRNDEIETTHL